jgi:hypothetical protein
MSTILASVTKRLSKNDSQVTAAWLSRGLKKKFYTDLQKNLKQAGFKSTTLQHVIGSQLTLALSDTGPDFIAAMKTLGWSKKTNTATGFDLKRPDGKWPVMVRNSSRNGWYLNITSDDGTDDEKRTSK